jgi:hypothetical protein
MIAMTISPGELTAAARLTLPANAWPTIPAPAATSTRKKVPSSSAKSRRPSRLGLSKSAKAWSSERSYCVSRPGDRSREAPESSAPSLSASAALLLLDGALSRWESLEALVGNRLAALDRESVGSRR